MRNRRTGSPDFGSDSFLDILANVVGVLIIFILIAGIKARNAPIVFEQAETIAKKADAEIPDAVKKEIEPAPQIIATPLPQTLANIFKELPRSENEVKTPIPVIDFKVDPELENQIQSANAHYRQSEAASLRLQNEIRLNQKERDQLNQQLASLAGKTLEQSTKSETLSNRISMLEKEFHEAEELKRQLIHRFDEAQRQAESATKIIRHRLNPVSKLVSGKEIHFHLSNNKIAHVPIEKLIERLKKQIQRQQRWILKSNRHRGRVGPEGGFTMTYIVQRGNPSVLNQFQSGGGFVRISLSEWRIDAEHNLHSENAAQALLRDSKFMQEIRAADPDATLTFWVYPDSFALYRQLEKFVHREGYKIAARPLPYGVPIAGSPNGTKSAGQ